MKRWHLILLGVVFFSLTCMVMSAPAEAQGLGVDVNVGGIGVTVGGPRYRYRVAPYTPYVPAPRYYYWPQRVYVAPPPVAVPAGPQTVVEHRGVWPFVRMRTYYRLE